MKARLMLRLSDEEWQHLKNIARQNNLNPEEMMTKALRAGLQQFVNQNELLHTETTCSSVKQ